ncbi:MULTISPECIES: type IV pilus modification protein PilV [Acinetobacter]|uniref:Type IV pilus modification protein PilV n=1 Tax=Acinetobacter indicus TaxID=756892 RepID=A0A7S7AEB6_9GAMM|nr:MULTISPECIES: type IV pilus modification protein PilV [Acinetobacter]QOW43160.1 type IV pilus modification protein PilV [Acinetobacter indicus]
MNYKSQQGVGLLEVLVALVILAIGALGYVMLQVRALEATAESSQRIQAINIARDLAEHIRANRNGWTGSTSYQTELATTAAQAKAAATPDCASAGCNPAQLADFDVAEISSYATQYGMSLGMSACPGTSNRQCLFVAWGNTKPINSTTDTASCTNETSYRVNSTCVMMEVY